MNDISIQSRLEQVADKISAHTRTAFEAVGASFHTGRRAASPPDPDERTGLTALLVNLLMGLLLISFFAGGFAGTRARDALQRQMTSVARAKAADLSTELARYRAIPYILSRDLEVVQAISLPDPDLKARLGAKLKDIVREANVGLIYVRDASGPDGAPPSPDASDCGRIVAYAAPPSSPSKLRVGGSSCNVLGRGKQEGFAFSRTAINPGMFFARPVFDAKGARIGTVGAKAEFAATEMEWTRDKLIIFVTDRDGVVLLSNVDSWRFRTLERLPDAVRAEIKRSARFGSAPLEPLPIDWSTNADGLLTIDLPDGRSDKFILSTADLGRPAWKLHVLTPANEPVRTAKFSVATTVLFSGLLAFNLFRSLNRRRLRRAVQEAKQIAARAELERRVDQRTRELQAANKALKNEMDERRRVARKVSSLREQLVQANKLATLGQVTAGVAHEINQPLAAIRTYSDSAIALIARAKQEMAVENLRHIGDLTEKISQITDQLRSFSRRATSTIAPMDLSSAIDGALMVSNHHLMFHEVKVVRRGESPKVSVLAERMRLEQVLVNLIQNAMEAMEGVRKRQLSVIVEDRATHVAVHIEDTGKGLSKKALHDLFMPFATSKPNGLGLGLVISQEIITEFGGELSAHNTAEGACFTFTLRKAVEPSES